MDALSLLLQTVHCLLQSLLILLGLYFGHRQSHESASEGSAHLIEAEHVVEVEGDERASGYLVELESIESVWELLPQLEQVVDVE